MVQSLITALMLGIVSVPSSVPQPFVGMENISIAPLSESLPIPRHLSASGVLVMDVQSGQRLYGKQVTWERSMASLTKLMTALVIVENHHLDEIVTVPEGIGEVIGNKAYLKPGEHYRVGDLLSAMLIASANDAARTLAKYHSGSVQKFVEEMNLRAVSLGLRNTSFENPDGLDGVSHFSTPQDMAWLMQYVLRHPAIKERMGTAGLRIVSQEGTVIPLSHTHALLHSSHEVLAGKTGTTDAAGECVVSLVEEQGKQYIIVIMNSLSRYTDLQTILTALSDNAHQDIAKAAAQTAKLSPAATQ